MKLRLGAAGAGGALVIAAALVALGGCSSGDDSTQDEGASPPAASSGGRAAPGEGLTSADSAAPDTDSSATAPTDRSVVKTAELSVRAADVDAAADKAIAAVAAVGGSLSSEARRAADDPAPISPLVDPAAGGTPEDATTGTGVAATADLTFRVPPDRLLDVIDSLTALGTVDSRTQQADDVTDQVSDVDARVASLQASVNRLRTLLERADSVTDVAAIEAELTRREADLASLQAQQRALSDQVAQATVTLHLANAAAAGDVEPGGFLGGLKSGWDALVGAATWLLTVLGALIPFLAVLAVPVLAVVAVVRRRGTRTGTPAAPDDASPAEPEPSVTPGP